jgi:uncharacterized protein
LPEHLPRGTLLRWVGWFGILNAGIFALIGMRYFFAFALPDSELALIYMILASLSQFAILGTLPLLILSLPLILIFPYRLLVSLLGISVGAIAITLLILDTNIFDQYRYHMSALTVSIFETSTWILAGIIFISMLAFQALLAGLVWRACIKPKQGRHGIWLAALLILVSFFAQGMHVWADATSFVPITQFTRVLPLYYPLKAKRSLMKYGLMDETQMERSRSINLARAPKDGQLLYPRAELQCDANHEDLPNILFIVVDAMRRDQVDSDLTPNIYKFAGESLDFQNHYSGGNSSRMGFFSMFYGLPSTYWQAFYSSQTPPVLMEQLQFHDYSMGLFSGVGFGSPSQIDRTVFAKSQSELNGVEGKGEAELSRAVTAAWGSWLESYSEKEPFFGFLYYDPGSAWSPPVGIDESVLTPAQRERAGYLRGLQFIDNQVAEVLSGLDGSPYAEDTLVILASDHGYEFDELGLGYVGHASNFSRWQLVSSLMIRWPGKGPKVFSHRSAHQDLPVTLLQEIFDCSGSSENYSSGKSLFDTLDWEWIVAGSYSSHAIVQKDKVVVTYPGGYIEVLGDDYLPAKGLRIDEAITEEVMLEMRRFYQ